MNSFDVVKYLKIMNSGKGIFEGYFPQHTSAIFLADVTIYL